MGVSLNLGGLTPNGVQTGLAWTVDATSGKGVPINGAQWTSVMSSAGIVSGIPSSLWLCQEASGALADSIGAISLTAWNSPAYQQPIAGWSRLAVAADDSVDAFYSIGTGNTATTSYALLAYVALSAAPSAARPILSIGGGVGDADIRRAVVTTAPVYSARGNGGVVTVDGASSPGTSVRPVVLLFNRATSTFAVLTDQEKLTTVWVNPVDGTSQYMSLFDGCETGRILYAALFSGTAAQLSAAQIKTLLQTLGWTIPWS